MIEQWQELKETIIELRDNNGTATQQEVCRFLANLMDVLEKQMQEPKTGHWIYDCRPVFGNPYGHYNCSICKREVAYHENYCPSCGKRMFEPQERSDKE